MDGKISKTFSFIFLSCFMSWSMFNSLNASFWAYFMTDVAGISAATMGLVLIISRTLDWVLAPVAGVVIEKTHLKWGKYRSWLLIAPPAIFVLLVMIFIDFPLSSGVKAIVLSSAYIAASIFISLTLVSLSTLISALGIRQEDRVILSARKGQGSTLAKIVFGMTALPLILLVNGGEKAAGAGYVVASLLFGAFFLFSFWTLFRITTEKNAPQGADGAKKHGTSLRDMVALLITNVPLLILVLAETSRYVAQWVLMGLAIYYFQYAFDDVPMMAVMLTIMNTVGLAGTFAVEFITKKIDKRTAYILGMMIMCVCLGLAWLLARDVITFIVLISIGWFGFNFMNGTQLALQSDCILYSEWKSGKTAKAFLMSTFQWCPKIANLVAGAVIGFGLTAIGYSKGVASSPELITGMNNLITLVPLVALVLSLLAMLFLYKLDTKKMNQIQKDLYGSRD